MSEKGTESPRNADPAPGEVIADRYRVDRLLARGGMAAVYLAHHVRLRRPVALKILVPPAHAEEGSAFEERFRLEAETLASLDHPNIVILHDFGDLDDGRFYLAMEFIDGPRLTDLLKEGPLPAERGIRLILQVCGALRYAHRQGVVHRDLKPSNLLVKTLDDGTEQVKVVDFGLVKLTEQEQVITRAGLILGSPHCMAPEQVRGTDIDHRADIYAIGVLLFRSLTGHYPFHGAHSAATMIAHLNQPIPTFESVAPHLDLPEDLEPIVRRCLAKNPDDRYPDMKALMEDLAAILQISTAEFRTVSTIQRRVGPPSRQSRGLMLLLGFTVFGLLVGTLVVAALVIALFANSPSPPAIQPPPPTTAAPERTPDEPPTPSDPGTQHLAGETADLDAEAPEGTEAPEPTPEVPDPEIPAPHPANQAPAPPAEAPASAPPRPDPAPAPAQTPPEEPAPEPEEAAPDGYMDLPDF